MNENFRSRDVFEGPARLYWELRSQSAVLGVAHRHQRAVLGYVVADGVLSLRASVNASLVEDCTGVRGRG